MRTGAALVWFVRRDGWMKRVLVDLPLPGRWELAEPDKEAPSLSIKQGCPPEPQLTYYRVVFELVKLHPGEMTPWAEPYYYREV